MASIFSVIIGFLLSFFKKKEQGQAAIDTIISEKNEVINEVQIAKKLRDNPNVIDIASVSAKYERKD